jgi:DNA-binding XRE family transcriptional regulator
MSLCEQPELTTAPSKFLSQEAMILKKVELLRLGIRIRRARKFLGFTRKKFATKCGLDRRYLRAVERGERNIDFRVLCAICDGPNL